MTPSSKVGDAAPARPRRGLYAITSETASAGRVLAAAVEAAIKGGAALVQYRDKSHAFTRRREQAAALVQVCHRHDIPLLINDDVDLALQVAADGVHIGKHDPGIGDARRALGANAVIGVSCYDSPRRALAAQRRGADYVAFGSFFPSSTKPDAVPVSFDVVKRVRGRLHIPLVAIGGITPENAPSLLAAGVDMIAVVSGLFAQPDIERAARAYARIFE